VDRIDAKYRDVVERVMDRLVARLVRGEVTVMDFFALQDRLLAAFAAASRGSDR
jgi:hypothetical protein